MNIWDLAFGVTLYVWATKKKKKKPAIQTPCGAHLCDLLLVINHQQRHRQQDGSEALDSFLEAPGGGQLVALLQAGDEVGEAQANSGQALLRPTVLKTIRNLHIRLIKFEEEHNKNSNKT